ncbi:MAG: 3'(2'),5'-bisphosphate nucleotidase CysQ [Gammaproteobacteria bacterium]|nr:3'(2'),5'-bisphosphate nucleotidase CysQ [Gammaproteobacteria bacterium]
MNYDVNNLVKHVIAIAVEASEKIMAVYSTEFTVATKEDDTPVTKADMLAHDVIMHGLRQLCPAFPVLSEESGKIPYHERANWETYWLVDPLDGTREFVNRNGEFTVNIALINQHKPVLGVIYTPVTHTCYYAGKNLGAFKLSADKTLTTLKTRKKSKDKTIVAGSRSHRGASLEEFLEKIGEYNILSLGSSLKSCLVAEGEVDIYPRLGPTSEWDTAAAQCIVEQAGGLLLDLTMQPMRYNTKDSLLNPHFIVIGDPTYDWAQHL